MKNQNTKNTLPLRGMVWAGIFTTAVLGGIYLKAANHLTELTATLGQLKAESASSEQQVSVLRHEVDEVAEDIAVIMSGQTASPDEVRRNATLAVIAQLKAAREVHPPAPRKPPPPTGMFGDIVFPELLSDPEYSAAYFLYIRAGIRRTKIPELLRLGLSEEMGEKAIDVLAEHATAVADYRQLAGNKASGATGAIAKSIFDDMNNKLRQIMGEEAYKRYDTVNMVKVRGQGGADDTFYIVNQARRSFIPLLEMRLSYSITPLQTAQADQLVELVAANSSARRTVIYRTVYSDAFIDLASKILSPPQIEALRQLQAEDQAFARRSKLPKSSELPRNTQTVK